MQGQLFPTRLVDEEPANMKTADLKFVGRDEHGNKYALKTLDDDPLLPLTEWFCYNLCRLVGVATPDYEIVERIHGDKAFGSKWDHGAEQINPSSMNPIEVQSLLKDSHKSVSRILSVDAFLPNEDRHLRNLLFRITSGRTLALAFDWSRTRIFDPLPFNNWPWEPNGNSAKLANGLMRANMLDGASVTDLMQRLSTCTPADVEKILLSSPDEWRQGVDTSAIIDWWANNARDRVNDATRLVT